MRKLLYTAAICLIGFSASYAQKMDGEKFTPAQRAERSALAMQKKLNLTDEQKTKIQKIELEKFTQQSKWRKEDAEAMKKKMEGRKASFKASEDKIAQILTPEQRATFTANRAAMRAKLADTAKMKHKRNFGERKFKRAPKQD